MNWNKFFFYLAAAGWMASLSLHILVLTGNDHVRYPSTVIPLSLGLFVVLIPAFLLFKQRNDELGFTGILGAFRTILAYTPVLQVIICVLGLTNAAIHTVIFLVHSLPPVPIRSFSLCFSAYWIANYGVAMTLLFPFKNRKMS
jgi:hypothetical protein